MNKKMMLYGGLVLAAALVALGFASTQFCRPGDRGFYFAGMHMQGCSLSPNTGAPTH